MLTFPLTTITSDYDWVASFLYSRNIHFPKHMKSQSPVLLIKPLWSDFGCTSSTEANMLMCEVVVLNRSSKSSVHLYQITAV